MNVRTPSPMRIFVIALALAALVLGTAVAGRAEDQAAERGDHPHIVRAIDELRAAINDMQASRTDFGGHREQAIAASREAIEQLQRALDHRSEQSQ